VKRLPPLPKAVWSQQGPIPVSVKSLHDEDAWGLFHMGDRRIALHKDASRDTQYATLFHEITEVILWDSGLHNVLPAPLKEAVCDAVGTYFASALAAGYLKLSTPKQ